MAVCPICGADLGIAASNAPQREYNRRDVSYRIYTCTACGATLWLTGTMRAIATFAVFLGCIIMLYIDKLYRQAHGYHLLPEQLHFVFVCAAFVLGILGTIFFSLVRFPLVPMSRRYRPPAKDPPDGA